MLKGHLKIFQQTFIYGICNFKSNVLVSEASIDSESDLTEEETVGEGSDSEAAKSASPSTTPKKKSLLASPKLAPRSKLKQLRVDTFFEVSRNSKQNKEEANKTVSTEDSKSSNSTCENKDKSEVMDETSSPGTNFI